MRVTAWHNGQTYYGVRITKKVRDSHFSLRPSNIDISFLDEPPERFNLTQSFWRECIEIRGSRIREWFQQLDYVGDDKLPNREYWPHGDPPKFDLDWNDNGYFDLVPLRPQYLEEQ
ncbi:MAG: hypothetical protein ACPG30_04705 [Parvibaculales bacterium]